MKHSIDYYIEHIEPMIDNLNRQQEIQINNTKFLVLKVRTKGVMYILIASQYNWNGVHYWVYNTNTKQVENIIHSTYHFMFRFKQRHLSITRLSENKQITVCMVNMFKYSYNLLNCTSSVYVTYKKLSKLGVPHIRFITYIRKTTKKKQYEYRIRNKMYNRSTYIGPADDGWSEIVKIDDKYYMVQQGLQEYEGHVYMSQVKIISIEILN